MALSGMFIQVYIMYYAYLSVWRFVYRAKSMHAGSDSTKIMLGNSNQLTSLMCLNNKCVAMLLYVDTTDIPSAHTTYISHTR